MENKLYIVQEENLCELGRQLTVIFDKSRKGYKEENAKVNAWNEIANSLDFIPDGMDYVIVHRGYLSPSPFQIIPPL